MNNKYVTFEQAKLLKEKGLRSYGCKIYHTENELREYPNIPKFYPEAKSREDVYESTDIYFAPEQHQVVDWLLEKHGIWIDVRYMDDILNFGYTITTIKDNTEQYGLYKFNYPQQAYSAAIDYILLNNII